jgi:hypothetical protein
MHAFSHRTFTALGLPKSLTTRHFRPVGVFADAAQTTKTKKDYPMKTQLNPIAFRAFAVVVAFAIVAAVAAPILSLASGAMA